ncbi:MAG: M48 family metalloprotease [Candidatus Gastranaerophilales bacterium]|nr:M48 family metalloprotease [Candidatus Gastranaerophilales bacterium]
MKKFLLLLLGLFFTVNLAFADVIVESNVNMDNFWQKNGKAEQKILAVSSKIINANKLDKRVPVLYDRTPKVINAFAYLRTKDVHISQGFLPYVDSDDELAYIISHEIAHSLDAYGGCFKWISMKFNSKSYEYKADLIGLDLMAKAGYNPLAGLIVANKVFPEPQSDWGFWNTHPIGSKRLMKMYKYIYNKYPQALDSQLDSNIYYVNFKYSSAKDIRAFEQKMKAKKYRNEEI